MKLFAVLDKQQNEIVSVDSILRSVLLLLLLGIHFSFLFTASLS
jgi:hypothetical protein